MKYLIPCHLLSWFLVLFVLPTNAETVCGSVIDSNGTPLKDVEVWQQGSGQDSAFTDDRGEFCLTVSEEEGEIIQLVIRAPGHHVLRPLTLSGSTLSLFKLQLLVDPCTSDFAEPD